MTKVHYSYLVRGVDGPIVGVVTLCSAATPPAHVRLLAPSGPGFLADIDAATDIMDALRAEPTIARLRSIRATRAYGLRLTEPEWWAVPNGEEAGALLAVARELLTDRELRHRSALRRFGAWLDRVDPDHTGRLAVCVAALPCLAVIAGVAWLIAAIADALTPRKGAP